MRKYGSKILDRGIPREKYRVMSPSPDYLLIFPQNQTYKARKIQWLAAVSLEELHAELSLSMSSGSFCFAVCTCALSNIAIRTR